MAAPSSDLLRRLEEVIERGNFVVPPYPAAAMRVRSVIEREKVGLAQVAEAASADPSLAMTLLRLANSPLYRGDGPPFTTLLAAVTRVGARSVSSLAVAAGIGAKACAPGPLVDVKYRVWRRSVTCALAAQKFAPGRRVDPEQAFLAGLLHGFGRSVAVACLEPLLGKLPEQRPMLEWLELVEPHRARLAARVAKAWQLPEPIAQAMGAELNLASPLGALTQVADQIARTLDRGRSSDEIRVELGLAGAEAQTLEQFIAGLPAALEALLELPEAKSSRTAAASAVLKPKSSLPGELRAVELTVYDLRKGHDNERFDAVAVAPLGLVINAPRPLQESCVIRVAVQCTPKQRLEAWFNVLSCQVDNQRFRIELQAFAPSHELREALAGVWARATKLAEAAPV